MAWSRGSTARAGANAVDAFMEGGSDEIREKEQGKSQVQFSPSNGSRASLSTCWAEFLSLFASGISEEALQQPQMPLGW